MDKRRAEIERSLRREQYPKVEHDPRLLDLARRFRRRGGPGGLEPAPADPSGGGAGSSGGAAAPIAPETRR